MKAVLFQPEHHPKVVRVQPSAGGGYLKSLQTFVGGSIQILPHTNGWDAPYVAYVNEDGLELGLNENYRAWNTLARLGFTTYSVVPGAHLGNVIVLGKDETDIADAQIDAIEGAYHAYCNEIGEKILPLDRTVA